LPEPFLRFFRFLLVFPPEREVGRSNRPGRALYVALGKDVRYVTKQVGRTDPAVTLGIYAQVMDASDEHRAQLAALVSGGKLTADGEAAAQARS